MWGLKLNIWGLYCRASRWEVVGLQRLTGCQGPGPAAWLHKGSEQWLLPQHQVPKSLRAGILEKPDRSLLFPNQSSVAIQEKEWQVTLSCWPKLLDLCSGKGLPVVLQGPYLFLKGLTTLLFLTAYGTWKKEPRFWCTSSSSIMHGIGMIWYWGSPQRFPLGSGGSSSAPLSDQNKKKKFLILFSYSYATQRVNQVYKV